MKNVLLLLTCIVVLFTNVIDNRDYPEDGYELYMFSTHVGYVYSDLAFEYSLTGR
tara:strand:+ start:6030 stop:6194 length:165 start_codon:yes stop_codon:yes gene_type:complete